MEACSTKTTRHVTIRSHSSFSRLLFRPTGLAMSHAALFHAHLVTPATCRPQPRTSGRAAVARTKGTSALTRGGVSHHPFLARSVSPRFVSNGTGRISASWVENRWAFLPPRVRGRDSLSEDAGCGPPVSTGEGEGGVKGKGEGTRPLPSSVARCDKRACSYHHATTGACRPLPAVADPLPSQGTGHARPRADACPPPPPPPPFKARL